jgi:hypothetical protein
MHWPECMLVVESADRGLQGRMRKGVMHHGQVEARFFTVGTCGSGMDSGTQICQS